MRRIPLFLSALFCPALYGQGVDIKPPVFSEKELHPFEFSIPAPRGLITDRMGKPLAFTTATPFLAISLSVLGDPASDAAPVSAVLRKLQTLESVKGIDLKKPTAAEISGHWKHRRFLPLIISGPDADGKTVEAVAEEHSHLTLEIRYTRNYRGGETASHIVGYVRPSMPEQHGPVNRGALKWPVSVAEAGLEKSYDEALSGQNGKVNILYDGACEVKNREFSARPRPGKTIVTTLNLDMQEEVFRLLKETGRPGAFVALDYDTGDILAMATYPSFDSMEFVNGISNSKYDALRNDAEAPLFDRAYQGAFPPGSAFKPFIGIAAMNTGVVYGTSTTFEAPPYLEIDGRRFNNWNDDHEGVLDIRYALMRSSNTWFYQAGIYTGSRAIISTAQRFGFGKKPDLPLESVAAGNLPDPDVFMPRQGIANLSIGQGDVLASPLQLASAMGGIGNGEFVAAPRIVLQVQSALDHVPETVPLVKRDLINFRPRDLEVIRAGMWAVVNHEYGTGKAGAHPWPDVYGKTGTSQWSTEGEERPLVWFAGFVRAGTPRIAFAVMLQGEPGEVIYGGRNAAPLAGAFLEKIYADPEKYGMTIPPRSENSIFTSTITGPATIKEEIERANQTQHVMSDAEVRGLVNQRRYNQQTENPPLQARPIRDVNTPLPRTDDASIFKKLGRFFNQ